MITQRRYWWTDGKARLVLDGDPEAAFLAFAPGTAIGDHEAARLGLLEPPLGGPVLAAPAVPVVAVVPVGTQAVRAAPRRSEPKGTDRR